VEIRLNVEHLSELDIEPGFLLEFAARCCANVFIPLHVATGNAPAASVWPTRTTSEQDLVTA
jgi:hypothetical protein